MPRTELDDLVQGSSFVKILLENQSDLVMFLDENGGLQYANDRMSSYLGSVEDPYAGHEYLNCFHNQDRNLLKQLIPEADKSIQKVILRMRKGSEKEFQELEFKIIHIDAEEDYPESILMIGKEALASMDSVADLAMDESVFKNFFQFLPDFVFLIHKNRIINSNNASKILLKCNIEQCVCTLDLIFVNPKFITDSLERKEVFLPNVELIGANGGLYICNASIVYLSSDSDTVLVILHDRTEVASLVSKYEMESHRYRTLFENMQTGMAEQKILFDDQGKVSDLEYVSVNPAFEIQTGLPKTVIGKGIRKVMPNFEDFWYDMFVRVALNGKSEYAENYVADVDRWYSVFVFSTGKNKVAQIFLDITGQKNMENKLMNALQEREILVKELHHRVQNNLQMIKGIIAMQYMRIDDPKVRLYLQEAESRIQAMGQVHLSLYSSDRLSSINLEAHLHNLVEEVADSFNMEVDADIKVDGEELQLGLEQSVAISIVINESLTNSFKFAFRGQKKGKIIIEIKNLSDSFIIVYRDFGEGYPTIPLVINTNTLGLNLVQNLVQRQLKGEVSFSNQNGARTEIVIPKIVRAFSHLPL